MFAQWGTLKPLPADHWANNKWQTHLSCYDCLPSIARWNAAYFDGKKGRRVKTTCGTDVFAECPFCVRATDDDDPTVPDAGRPNRDARFSKAYHSRQVYWPCKIDSDGNPLGERNALITSTNNKVQQIQSELELTKKFVKTVSNNNDAATLKHMIKTIKITAQTSQTMAQKMVQWLMILGEGKTLPSPSKQRTSWQRTTKWPDTTTGIGGIRCAMQSTTTSGAPSPLWSATAWTRMPPWPRRRRIPALN